MALRELKLSDLKCYTVEQTQQRSQYIRCKGKEVVFNIAGNDHSVELLPCYDPLIFDKNFSKISLDLHTSDAQLITLYFGVDALNRLLHFINMPQIITGVNEEFLTSIMEVLTAGFLESLLGESLTLASVDIIKSLISMDEDLDLDDAKSYEIHSESYKVFTFMLLSRNKYEVLDLWQAPPTLINVKVLANLGFAQVYLSEDDFNVIEPGDLLRMSPLTSGVLLSANNGISFFNSCTDDTSEISQIAPFNMVYKSVRASLRDIIEHKITAQGLLSNPGLVFLSGEGGAVGIMLAGHLLTVKGQSFLAVTEKARI